MRDALTFVMVGHVDHGKSSLIGRLLHDTDSVSPSKIEKVKKVCEEKGKDFEYAYLLDALSEEREQGITIDTTSLEFSTKKRDYTIIDAPGHKEFLKNMISGASKASAAILIIDAAEGMMEQSRKHAYILSLLGMKQVFVVINKMDLVEYSKDTFDTLCAEAIDYLAKIGINPQKIIPISATKGDWVSQPSTNMSWYAGPTVLEALDTFQKEKTLENQSLRFPVQDVYKFDHRRIIAGKIESGTLSVGDEIVFTPSGNTTTVISIEQWPDTDTKTTSAFAGQSVGITVADEYFFKRGQIISHLHDKPKESDLIACKLFWMGSNPLKKGNFYTLKIGTQEFPCEIYGIDKVIDSNTLEQVSSKFVMDRHDVASVFIRAKHPVAYDTFQKLSPTGRFVLVDGTTISGGGIIDGVPRVLSSRGRISSKSPDIKMQKSLITRPQRTERSGHKGIVVWVTGLASSGKSSIAQVLERELFLQRKQVYHINASNFRFSLSSDLDFTHEGRAENNRRLAETANILMDAGFIVIISAVSPFRKDREMARSIIGPENFLEVFVDTPLEICKKRNQYGIYENSPFPVPGKDFPYEKSEYLVYTLNVNEVDFDVKKKAYTIITELEKHI